MRYSLLASVLATLTVVAFTAAEANAVVYTYSDTDVVLAGNSSTTDSSLLASGLLDAADDFTITGSLTVTPSSLSSFDLLFLVGDGSGNSFFGGRIEDIGSTYRASANAGFSFVNAEINQDAFFNGAATSPLTIDFVITGGDGTPTTTSVDNINGSPNTPGSVTNATAGINTLNPSTGFTISLVNDDSAEFTIDSIDITVIPEPLAASLLGGLALACLGRRRSA